MHKLLPQYEKINGKGLMKQIYAKSEALKGKKILIINSTRVGGGVAEILEGATRFLDELGIEAEWQVLPGTLDFFAVTKKIHNALQGSRNKLTEQEKELHQKINEGFAATLSTKYDLVMIHDPQPLPLIRYCNKKQPWIFRCHIDLSSPNTSVWAYIRQDINKYDHFI
ncbi:glycosyl transferase family 1, partial [Patescibacteria group bacterium]